MTDRNELRDRFAPSRLEALADLARNAGLPGVAQQAAELATRVAEGRFYVACVGQFKRGKSTLLNALVGIDALPVGVAPVTSVVTVLRYGPSLRARVQLGDAGWRDIELEALPSFVTEEENPSNGKEVTAAELFAPHPLLRSGMCLVDTPGVGSVFLENTRATRTFVPRIDAALVVLGADPPISAEELALVAEVAKETGHLVFVLSKTDKFSERERQEAVRFTRATLTKRLDLADVLLLEVSGRQPEATAPLAQEWAKLGKTLSGWATDSGADLVGRAEERGLQALATNVAEELEQRKAALLSPLRESEQRLERLRAFVTDAQRSIRDLTYLMTAEQAELARQLADRKSEFLDQSLPLATKGLETAIGSLPDRTGLRRKAFDIALEISKMHVRRWIEATEPFAQDLYRRAADRFVELANDFLARLAATASVPIGRLGRPVEPEAGIRARTRFFHHELVIIAHDPPGAWLGDVVSSRRRLHGRAFEQASRYLKVLIEANANRFETDVDDRIVESRRRFEHEIRARLGDLSSSAERAVSIARETQAQGVHAVRSETHRIERWERKLATLRPAEKDEFSEQDQKGGQAP
jgi:hypothetical protein